MKALLNYAAGTLVVLAILAVSPGQEPPVIKVAAPTPQSLAAQFARQQRQILYDQATKDAAGVMMAHGCSGQFAELIGHAAVDHRLPANVVAAVAVIESTCNPNAAHNGDCGIMQINAAIWHMSCQMLKDPATNVTKATQILAQCVRLGGGIHEGLRRYNGLDKPDDRGYADKVLGIAYGAGRV